MPGTLYIVATPIGNLEDMTHRAVRILREADLIACEDTRQTRKLLEHYGIKQPTVSYHEHNEAARAEELVNKLTQGTNIALVSDAGMPLVSDPGYRLVSAAIRGGITVVPIPGASALVAALAASVTLHPTATTIASATNRTLEALKHEQATLIFYEAPHRIADALADIGKALGPRRVVVARELTKIHEEFLRGTPAELEAHLRSRPSVKGEITLLIARAERGAEKPADGASLESEVQTCMRQGMSRMEALKQVAHQHGLSKREAYRLLEEQKKRPAE